MRHIKPSSNGGPLAVKPREANAPADRKVIGSAEEYYQYICPPERWTALNLREVWRHRTLFWLLLMRDVRMRYMQTWLGAGWIVLEPLLLAVIFSVVFGVWGRLPTYGIPPVLFYLSGFVPWAFFATALQGSVESLVSEANLIRKVYFPRLIIPMIKGGGSLVDFACNFLILVVLMFCCQRFVGPAVLAVPLFVVLIMGLALGIGFWLAGLHAEYADVGKIVHAAVRFWMYLSPVVYSTNMIPAKWKSLYFLNPMAGFIEGFRWCLFQVGEAPGPMLWVSAAVVAGILVSGAYVFRYREANLADVV